MTDHTAIIERMARWLAKYEGRYWSTWDEETSAAFFADAQAALSASGLLEVLEKAEEAVAALNIESAPKGKVVLTDQGTGIFDGRWYLCTASGNVPSCGDWGREVSEIEPSLWMPMPYVRRFPHD